MFKSIWIVFVSLQSVIHCGTVGNAVNPVPLPVNPVSPASGHSNGIAVADNSPSASIGYQQRAVSQAPVTISGNGHVNSRSISLGGGLNTVHSPLPLTTAHGGFDIGNGYLGYSNYHSSNPVVYQKALPVTTTIIKTAEPEPDWTLTPSISYGYSYKLVPTHAYAPAHPPKSLLPNLVPAAQSLSHSINSLLHQVASSLFVRRVPHHHQHQHNQQQHHQPQVVVHQHQAHPFVHI